MEIVQGIIYRVTTEGADKLEKLSGSLDLVQKSAEGSAKSAGNVSKAFQDAEKQGVSKFHGALTKLAGYVLPAGIAYGLATIGKKAIDAADNLLLMSTKTGVSVENLSVLGHAAKLAGTSLEALNVGFKGMSRAVDDALGGNKNLVKTFVEDLGISVSELRTLSPNDLFVEIANGLQGISDSSIRSATAHEVLGRSAHELLPLMKDLSGNGFAAVTKEAERLGVVVSTKTAIAADQFNDNLDRMKGYLQGAANTIVAELLPAANELGNALVNKAGGGATKALGPMEALTSTLKGVAGAVVLVVSQIKTLSAELGVALETTIAMADAYTKLKFGDMAGILRNGYSSAIDEARRARREALESLDRIWNGATLPGSTQVIGGPADAHVAAWSALAAERKKAAEEAARIANERSKELATVSSIHEANARMLRDLVEQSELGKEINRLNDQRLTQIRQIQAMERLSGRERAEALRTIEEQMMSLQFRTVNDAFQKLHEQSAAAAAEAMLKEQQGVAEAVIEKWRTAGKVISDDLAASIARTSPIIIANIQGTVDAVSGFFRGALRELSESGSLEQSFGSVADRITETLQNSLGVWLDDWLKKLESAALGTPIKDEKGNVTGYVAGSGSSGARAGLIGIQGLAAAYSIYGNAREGGSRTAGVVSGAASGAAIGTQIYPGIGTAIGAIVGAIVGGIAAGIGAAQKRDEYKFGHFAVMGGRSTLFSGSKNINEAEQKQILAEIQTTFDTVWNAYTKILLAFPNSLLPQLKTLEGTVDGNFQREASKNYMKHLKEWLGETLPREIAETFRTGMEAAFTGAGMGSERFAELWREANSLDPKKALEFWGNLAEGMIAFDRAARNMEAVNSSSVTAGRYRFGADGQLAASGESEFMTNLRGMASGLFEQARAMVAMTGPDRVAAFKALGQGIEGVTRSLQAFITQIGEAIEANRQKFHDVRLDRELERTQDPNERNQIMLREYNRNMGMLLNAEDLGLSIGQVNNLRDRNLALLDEIYKSDPSEEMYQWWLRQMDSLEAVTTTAFIELGNQARDQVNALLDQLGPFKDWFLGLPVDLEGAVSRMRIAFDGGAQAMDELAEAIRRASQAAQPDPNPGGGGGGGIGGPGGGGGGGNGPPDGRANITVQINAPTYGVRDIISAAEEGVKAALRSNPAVLDRAY